MVVVRGDADTEFATAAAAAAAAVDSPALISRRRLPSARSDWPLAGSLLQSAVVQCA